jgi:aspartate-semialdehyde dehydrogenase
MVESMKKFGYKIAVFNPTSLLGKEIQGVLTSRKFPYESVKLIDSEDNLGILTMFEDEAMIVTLADDDALENSDIVFFCGNSKGAGEIMKLHQKLKFFAFDLTGSQKENDSYKHFVSGYNDHELKNYKGIIASPHPVTIPLVRVLAKLDKEFKIKNSNVTVMTSVSDNGSDGIKNLHTQTRDILGFNSIKGKQRIFNVFPQDEDYLEETEKIEKQISSLLSIDRNKLTVSILNAPVFYGNFYSLYVELEGKPGSEYSWERLFNREEGFSFDGNISEGIPAVGAIDISETDHLHVQIMKALDKDYSKIWFWILADNIRFCSVINIINLAEVLIKL